MHTCLREEGEFLYKQALVNTILDLMEKLPDMKTAGLNALGEFIEDCEFPQLSKQVLHVLGSEAPTTGNPGRYIRYIFNRVILEVPSVRAAAVSALAKLAAAVPSLRSQVRVLLDRCQLDDDDEVRDRATMFVAVLSKTMKADEQAAAEGSDPTSVVGMPELGLITDGLPQGISVRALEKAVVAFSMKQADSTTPLTLDTLPIVVETGDKEEGYEAEVVEENADADAIMKEGDAEDDMGGDGGVDDSLGSDANYAAELYAVPAFASLGKLLKSSRPVALSEEESEYNVQCVKHTFSDCLILQFNVRNTVNEQVLREVKMELEFEDPDAWSVDHTEPAPLVSFQQPGQTYVLVRPAEDAGLAAFQSSSIGCELLFFACECDPSTGELLDEEDEGLDDQYPVEPVEIGPADFIGASAVLNFREQWQDMADCNEIVETFDLAHFADIRSAVAAIIDSLGMTPCDGTAAVVPQAKKHMVLLAGTFATEGQRILARAHLQRSSSDSGGVRMKVGFPCLLFQIDLCYVYLNLRIINSNAHNNTYMIPCIRLQRNK